MATAPKPTPPLRTEHPESVFARRHLDVYQYRWAITLHVPVIVGGIPSNPKVAEAWLKTKLAPTDDLLRELVAETMAELNLTADEAAKHVAENQKLNAFKRDPTKGLYIESRQVKAAIKEMVSVAADSPSAKIPTKGLGENNARKGILSYVAEHIFIPQRRIFLMDADGNHVTKPTGVEQRFVHTFRGSGIQYEEYVEDAYLPFTVITDHPFTDDQWATLWVVGEKQGIGASRSQGYGTYAVVKWERVK